jgi:SAM-dependent methyltransferase
MARAPTPLAALPGTYGLVNTHDYRTFADDSVPLNPQSIFFLDHVTRYWWASTFADGRDVLDCACGRGYGSYILSHRARSVVGVDLNPASLATARATFPAGNLQFDEADVFTLARRPSAFGLITAFEVIEHVPPTRTDELLDALAAALAPGGLLLLSTPNHDVVTKSGASVPEFHINNLRPWDLRAALRRHFRRVEMRGQFHRRGLLNGLAFTLDVWNLRHSVRRAPSGGGGAPTVQEDDLVAARPYFERRPVECDDYRFSRWHWRQAGLTVAICSA